MNIVYNGESDATIEQSIGVMREIATRNDICAKKNPSTEAAKIFGKSRRSTRSFGRKSEIIQNREPAPMERKVNNASGEMSLLEVRSLHTTMLRPKIRYAVKQARCPNIDLFIFTILNLTTKIVVLTTRCTLPHENLKVFRFPLLVFRFFSYLYSVNFAFEKMEKKIVVKLQGAGIYHAENPNITLTPKTREKAGEKVLSNIDLEISAGEVVYLIGRVGSGKSSLLKTFYGELPLVEGEGTIAEFDLANLKSSKIPYLRRKVGMVFQELILLSDRNVHDNLLVALKATGWNGKGAIEHRIEEVLTLVGLQDKGEKMPFELSGGERQRLTIARALLNSPDVILADEPTVNLDPLTAEGIVRLFHEIAAKGTAIVMSTHNTSLIESYPSRTLLFAHGTIREVNIEELIGAKSAI